MLFAYRVTAGQEAIVADLLNEKIKKAHGGISTLIVSPKLRGYLISEAPDELEAKRAITNVPHVKGMLHKPMALAEITELIESKPVEVVFNPGDLVEITSGPFKGEKAKVAKLNLEKGEVTVELIEVAVPIPVTIKAGVIKMLAQ